MASDDNMKALIGLLLQMWERGSILLWALAAASLFAGLAMTGAIYYRVAPLKPELAAAFIIGCGALAIVAGFKRHQERSIVSLALVPNAAQSFWHHTPQQDGRKLTQIALSGWATNCTDRPLYPSLVRNTSPFGTKTESEFVITQGPDNRTFGSAHPVQPGDRREISAHFFAKGFIGRQDHPLRVVVSVCDNLGRWHKWVFPQLTYR
jgi:hypothetical protein